jgi:hypothetical protein
LSEARARIAELEDDLEEAQDDKDTVETLNTALVREISALLAALADQVTPFHQWPVGLRLQVEELGWCWGIERPR